MSDYADSISIHQQWLIFKRGRGKGTNLNVEGGERISISHESQWELLSALCAPQVLSCAFTCLNVANCQGCSWWLPHGTFKGELSYQFWGSKLPYSILVPILTVGISKATRLWLLWGSSGSSLLFPSLGQKPGHLVSSIVFPQLFKLGTELRSCCHLNRLLKTGKALAVVVFGNIGGCCARCWESQLQSLGVNAVTGWWVLSALPLVLPTQPFNCLSDK